MDEQEGQRVKLFTDDSALLASSLAEPINLEGQLEMKGDSAEWITCILLK